MTDIFRVMLVEDDDDHAELATFHLEAAASELSLLRLRDGKAALMHLQTQARDDPAALPDLVLLDLQLETVDGLAVLEKVRSDPTLSSVPVVVFSTSNAEHDKLAAYARHASSYLVKPADFDEYRNLMKRVVAYWRDCNRRPQGNR